MKLGSRSGPKLGLSRALTGLIRQLKDSWDIRSAVMEANLSEAAGTEPTCDIIIGTQGFARAKDVKKSSRCRSD